MAQVAAWIRKRLPAIAEMPKDSYQVSREHWEQSKARGKVTADPMKGTRWEHVKVEPVEIVKEN